MQVQFLSKYNIWLLCLFLLSLSSCSVSKFTRNNTYNTVTDLQIAQQDISAAYNTLPENALPEEILSDKENINAQITSPEQNLGMVNRHQSKKAQFRKVAGKIVNTSVQKVKKLTPDTKKLVQTAAKEWKPNKSSVHITLTDILFVIVLLALLALIGGLLHNFFGLTFTLTMIIAIAIGFFVVWLYIWFNNNETYK